MSADHGGPDWSSCEDCDRYVPPNDAEDCPRCGGEVCPKCWPAHACQGSAPPGFDPVEDDGWGDTPVGWSPHGDPAPGGW